MKKLSQIRTAVELSQADDRRSPLADRVFSLVGAKPKGDRRNGWDKGMKRLPLLQPHSFAEVPGCAYLVYCCGFCVTKCCN